MRERGLKLHNQKYMLIKKCVAPVRERGLKSIRPADGENPCERRSREGAWIEMQLTAGSVR